MPTQEEVKLYVCEHLDWNPFNEQLLRLVNGKLPAYVHTRAALRPSKVKLCEKCTDEFEKKQGLSGFKGPVDPYRLRIPAHAGVGVTIDEARAKARK